MDWNAYARFDRLFLKLFMEEQETTVHILLDCSASMDFGEPSKWEMAQGLAQLLCYMAIRGGDRAVIIALGEEIIASEVFSGRAGFMRATAFLQGLVAQGTAAFVPADAARATAAGTWAMLRHQRSDERGWL